VADVSAPVDPDDGPAPWPSPDDAPVLPDVEESDDALSEEAVPLTEVCVEPDVAVSSPTDVEAAAVDRAAVEPAAVDPVVVAALEAGAMTSSDVVVEEEASLVVLVPMFRGASDFDAVSWPASVACVKLSGVTFCAAPEVIFASVFRMACVACCGTSALKIC
jgi:hypothetical protein